MGSAGNGPIQSLNGSPSDLRRLEEQGDKLVQASSAGDVDRLRELLGSVQSLNPAHLPTDGFLLQTAAKQGQAESTRFLFQHLPGCLARPDKRWDPLLPDGYTYNDIPDKWHVYEDGVIHEAIGGKDPVGLFRVFFDFGMDPNIGLGVAGSPLAQAVSSNQLALAEYLLFKGADPNGYYMSNSLLGVAARLPNDEVLRALLGYGARVAGSRALQQAAQYWRTRTAETLLEHGADIDEIFTRSQYDDSMQLIQVPLGCALHFAVEGGMREGGTASQSDFVRFLLGRGARTDLVNDRRETPVQVAERLGKTSIVDIIESRGLDK
ncbi:hypothetical protein J3459_015274 [Metarhizium acridum]|uniref:Ankyrin repeat protein n=1 Tax=Metarhizium acridum (strain CQMa 102) TaxID=655827 RepID=E9DUZ4_METAQ|nr:ankyrin repeat protein [Metarhizium acridum CQMa 102]EFY92561.1 ankyrin repeat protein [Metarhizium acridum CQMa 102]KAG8413529.1 hypothetical protein J3459_015274 [Metarhizium acridum]KAG8413992.1 hypothetical protein J3458_011647 [Metarhizium acridum]